MGTPLTSVSGIGPAAAKVLAEHGYTSAEQLAASVIEELVKVPGFGAARAATTLRAARSLVEGAVAGSSPPAAAQGAPAKTGKGGKAKGKGRKKDEKKGGKKAAAKRNKKDKKRDKKDKQKKDGKKPAGRKSRKSGKRKKK